MDSDFLVHCYDLTEFNHIEIRGCELIFNISAQTPLPAKNQMQRFRLRSSEKIIENEIRDKLDCSNSLEVYQFKSTKQKDRQTLLLEY